MYCPNCGTEIQPDKKFCRACGMDLNLIVRAMNGTLPTIDPAQVLAESPRRKMVKMGFITVGGGIFLAALLAIFSEVVLPMSRGLGSILQNLAPLGGLITAFGLGMMIYSLFLPKAQTVRPFVQPQIQPQIQMQPPHAQLPPESHRQPIGSVTESTTRLFEEDEARVPARDRASQKQ
jgi:hypothetical protein